MEGLTEGRIVHYVLPDGRSKGQHRPAIVVRVFPSAPDGLCNLQVFTDGSNDAPLPEATLWAPSRPYSEGKEPGAWHWIERA